MASIFSGVGLGFFAGTYNKSGQLPEQLTGNSNQNGYAINIASGNLVLQSIDHTLEAIGHDFSSIRTYNSQGEFDGDNNDNWRLGYIKSIEIENGLNTQGSRITRITADGFRQVFEFDSETLSYVSKEGDSAHDTITVKVNNSNELNEAVYTNGNGVIEHYDSNKRLVKIADRLGNSSSINYENGKPSEIVNHNGDEVEKIDIVYNSLGLLQSYVSHTNNDGNLQKVYYEYDEQKRLSAVITDLTFADRNIADGNVSRTEYTYYNNTNLIETIRQDVVKGTNNETISEKVTTFTYDSKDRIKTIIDANSITTKYTYDIAVSGSDLKQTNVDVAGRTVKYQIDANKQYQ